MFGMDLQALCDPGLGRQSCRLSGGGAGAALPVCPAPAIWAAWGSRYLTKVTRRPSTGLKLGWSLCGCILKSETQHNVFFKHVYDVALQAEKQEKRMSVLQGHFNRNDTD